MDGPTTPLTRLQAVASSTRTVAHFFHRLRDGADATTALTATRRRSRGARRRSGRRSFSMGGSIVIRTLAVLVVAALLAVSESDAQTFAVQGACRDGVPHGAWQLTDASGHLRVLGAFSRGRRTGSFIFWDANGARIAHLPYEEDAKNGTLALWYARGSGVEGPQRLEAVYAAGRLNGVVRAWDSSGRLRGEYRYAAGTLAEAKAWDPRGRELAEQEARAQAAKDASVNESYLQTLEALVARHARSCGAPPPTTTSALDGRGLVPGRDAIHHGAPRGL